MGILAQYLKEKNLSASELARRAKISRSGLSLYLSGKRVPRITQLQRLAAVTRIPLSKLASEFKQ